MTLKLKIHAEPEETNSPAPAVRTSAISPRMTLTQFFDNWFLPIVLNAERECRETTIGIYRDALGWWAKLTGNPPLNKIDEFVLALFQTKLREATFRRSELFGDDRPLSKHTQRKHLRHIRAILYRTGPQHDANRQTKELLEKTPTLRLSTPHYTLKPSFAWEQVLAMIAAADKMALPSVPGVSPRDYWRCFVALFFYTGQRAGTLQALTWKNVVVDEQGQHWLEVPAELVSKTQKETRVIVHACLLEALQAVRRTDVPAEPLLPRANGYRWIMALHNDLQGLAGIDADKRLSPHAWRRTHSDQLAQLGLAAVAEVCRNALDHSDIATTTGHYVDLLSKFRLQLPRLW